MAKASAPRRSNGTINPQEAEHFGTLAADWWNPKGSSAMLHRLNPVRLGYIRAAIDRHFGTDERAMKPLVGRRALDVGCGAGLVCEPLARMGAAVTGIDAAAENIAVARAHAEAGGLAIDYRHCGIEDLGEPDFDLVTSLEVIEHVDDPDGFVAGLAAALSDEGMLVLSTPNRTAKSRLMLVEGAERTGQIPRGTHDWHKFLTPDELGELLSAHGLEVVDTTGLGFRPTHGFELGGDRSLNYLVTAVKR